MDEFPFEFCWMVEVEVGPLSCIVWVFLFDIHYIEFIVSSSWDCKMLEIWMNFWWILSCGLLGGHLISTTEVLGSNFILTYERVKGGEKNLLGWFVFLPIWYSLLRHWWLIIIFLALTLQFWGRPCSLLKYGITLQT